MQCVALVDYSFVFSQRRRGAEHAEIVWVFSVRRAAPTMQVSLYVMVAPGPDTERRNTTHGTMFLVPRYSPLVPVLMCSMAVTVQTHARAGGCIGLLNQ